MEYLEKTEDILTTSEEHEKRQGGTMPEGHEKRQGSQRNRARVRCDLSMTGDFKFVTAVNENNVDTSPESRRRVAASLLVSYVQGASRIFQVPPQRSDASLYRDSVNTLLALYMYNM